MPDEVDWAEDYHPPGLAPNCRPMSAVCQRGEVWDYGDSEVPPLGARPVVLCVRATFFWPEGGKSQF